MIFKTNEIPLVYIPRSPYHSRFPSLFGKISPIAFNTYHRSSSKKLYGVKKKEYTFKGNQTEEKLGMYSKTGNFYNPFYFNKYKEALRVSSHPALKTKKGFWYDLLLNFQKKSAQYVVGQMVSSPRMQVNADYDYPCVLVALAQPEPREKNIRVWTNFVAMYFVALCNKLAQEQGLNIEMVRRSSFSGVRPSVAECRKSLRISLGLSPRAYHHCVIEALGYLDKLFENTQVFELKLDVYTRVQAVLEKYNRIKSSQVHLKDSLWKSLWANGDCQNRSFASQIFRHEHVVEVIIDDIFLRFGSKPLQDIFLSIDSMQVCFALPLLDYFASLHCDHDRLSSNLVQKELMAFSWSRISKLNDLPFWSMIKDYGLALGADAQEIHLLCDSQNLAELYPHLESWLLHFTFRPRVCESAMDGCGSDSEVEVNLELHDKPQLISSKKLITATGMRAIQLSYAAAKKYLKERFSFDAQKMYYETCVALQEYPIPGETPLKSSVNGKSTVIRFFDINHCNIQHMLVDKKLPQFDPGDRVCILDTTSATTIEIAQHMLQIWYIAPSLRVIILVSSGLKNEQAMSDYNPYGCLRIFAKSKLECDMIYADLKQLEQEAGYKHPLASHLIRKTAKADGFTPTSSEILKKCQS